MSSLRTLMARKCESKPCGNKDYPCASIPFLPDKIELGDSDLKIMLKKHHEKRKYQPVRLEGVVGRWSVLSPGGCPEDRTGSHCVLSPLSLYLLVGRSSMEAQEHQRREEKTNTLAS